MLTCWVSFRLPFPLQDGRKTWRLMEIQLGALGVPWWQVGDLASGGPTREVS